MQYILTEQELKDLKGADDKKRFDRLCNILYRMSYTGKATMYDYDQLAIHLANNDQDGLFDDTLLEFESRFGE